MKSDPITRKRDASERKINATLPASNVEDPTSLLVKLEAKYARQDLNLRIDAAEQIPSGPHVHAAKFRSYTEWLTRHTSQSVEGAKAKAQKASPVAQLQRFSTVVTPESKQTIQTSQTEVKANTSVFPSVPAPKTPTTHFRKTKAEQEPGLGIPNSDRPTTTTTPAIDDPMKFANPDILVTADLNAIPPATNSPSNGKPELAVTEVSNQSDLSIPVDESKFSVNSLFRIDAAHSTQTIAKPRSPRWKTSTTSLPTQTNTDSQPTARESGTEPLKVSPSPTQNIPSSIVTWEVNDFLWPGVISQMGLAKTSAANALANVAMQVLSETEQRLGIVGSGRGPGTTTIAMYVARILAARQHSVLLIDADLSKPDLTADLGIPQEVNWLNAVKGTGNICDSIVRSVETGICVMPVHKLSTRVTWPRFLFDCLGELVDEVRFEFDYVLIDLGPVSQVVRELSRPNLLVDASMLVHNVRVPDHSTLVRNQNELNSFGMKRLVVAENFSAKVSSAAG